MRNHQTRLTRGFFVLLDTKPAIRKMCLPQERARGTTQCAPGEITLGAWGSSPKSFGLLLAENSGRDFDWLWRRDFSRGEREMAE